MEPWNPSVTATTSPKIDSDSDEPNLVDDSDVDEEYPEDMIDDFMAPDTPVNDVEEPLPPPIAATKPPAPPIAAKEKPTKPVKPVRPPLPPADIDKRPFDGESYLRVYGKDDMEPYVDKYKRNLHSIKPIVFEGGVKCQIINAHMGAGKSHASLKFIKADAATGGFHGSMT